MCLILKRDKAYLKKIKNNNAVKNINLT